MRPFLSVELTKTVTMLSMPPNHKIDVSYCQDNTICLRIKSVEGESNVIKAYNIPVNDVSFNADVCLIAYSSSDKLLKLINTGSRRFLCSFNAHLIYIKTGLISPDSRMLASGSDDMTIRLWDINLDKKITVF